MVAGTYAEYGMQPGMLSENIEPHPCNSYGFIKNTLRLQLEHLKDVHPFNLTWTRLFYLYGDGQADTALLPQLKRRLNRGTRFLICLVESKVEIICL